MKCENEIECAERRILVYSWIGILSSITLIVYTAW